MPAEPAGSRGIIGRFLSPPTAGAPRTPAIGRWGSPADADPRCSPASCHRSATDWSPHWLFSILIG
jgi:hypothetical protein